MFTPAPSVISTVSHYGSVWDSQSRAITDTGAEQNLFSDVVNLVGSG